MGRVIVVEGSGRDDCGFDMVGSVLCSSDFW